MTDISINNNCETNEELPSSCSSTSTMPQNHQAIELDVATADLKSLDQKKESIDLETLSAEQQGKLFERVVREASDLSLYDYLLSHPKFKLDEALKSLVGTWNDDTSYAAKRAKAVSDLIDHGADPNKAYFWRIGDVRVIVEKNILQRLEPHNQASLFNKLADHPISDVHHSAIKQLDQQQRNEALLHVFSGKSQTSIDLAKLLFQEGASVNKKLKTWHSVSKEIFEFLKQEKFTSFSPEVQSSIVLAALGSFELNEMLHMVEEYALTSKQQSEGLARVAWTNPKKAIELAAALLQTNPNLDLNPALKQALSFSSGERADIAIFLLNHGADINKCSLNYIDLRLIEYVVDKIGLQRLTSNKQSELIEAALNHPISDVHTRLIVQLTLQQKEKATWKAISSDADTAIDFARMLFDNGATLTKYMRAGHSPKENTISKQMFDFLKQEKFSSFSKEVKDAITFHALPNLNVDEVDASGFAPNTIISKVHKKEVIEHLLQQGTDCNLMQFNEHEVSKESFDFLWSNQYCQLNKRAKLDLVLHQKHLSNTDAWNLLQDFPIDLVLQQALQLQHSSFIEQALERRANLNNIDLHRRYLSMHAKTLLKHSKHELTKATKIKLASAASYNLPDELKQVMQDNVEEVIDSGHVSFSPKILSILEKVPKTSKLLDKLLGSLSHGDDFGEENAGIKKFIFTHYTFACNAKYQYPEFQLPDGSLRLVDEHGNALIHALLRNFDNDCAKQLLVEHPGFGAYHNPNFESPIHAAFAANNTIGVSLCWQVCPDSLHASNNCNAIKQLALTLPSAFSIQDTPYEQHIVEQSNKFVILIQGPNTHDLMPEYITSMVNYIQHHNISFAMLGDGNLPVSLGAIERRLTEIQSNIKESVEIEIVFFAHGHMQKDAASGSEHHVVQLGTPIYTKTSYVFDVWTKIFPHKNIPVSFVSCLGGGASLDVDHLPGNQSSLLFFAMSHQSVSSGNFGETFLFTHKTIFDSIKSNYLISSKDGFITFPGIANANGIEYSIDSCQNIVSLLTEENIQTVTRSICGNEQIKSQFPQYTTCENLVRIIAQDLPNLKIDVIKSPILRSVDGDAHSEDTCSFDNVVAPNSLEEGSYYNLGLTIFVCGELKVLSQE